MPSKYTLVDNKKEIFEVLISPRDVMVTKNDIELNIGYNRGAIPEHFSEIIEDIILQIPDKCEIRAGFRLIDIGKSGIQQNGIYIKNILFNTDKIVAGMLKKSERVAVFTVTIGKGMELWNAELQRNNEILMSYLVDTAASATVENVTDYLHDQIGIQMKEHGMNITNRYSPGYCNWPVSDQHKLFSLLPFEFCGISLTDSSLMMPVKSISGVIGIGKTVKFMDYTCNTCGVKDCTYKAYLMARNKEINKKGK